MRRALFAGAWLLAGVLLLTGCIPYLLLKRANKLETVASSYDEVKGVRRTSIKLNQRSAAEDRNLGGSHQATCVYLRESTGDALGNLEILCTLYSSEHAMEIDPTFYVVSNAVVLPNELFLHDVALRESVQNVTHTTNQLDTAGRIISQKHEQEEVRTVRLVQKFKAKLNQGQEQLLLTGEKPYLRLYSGRQPVTFYFDRHELKLLRKL